MKVIKVSNYEELSQKAGDIVVKRVQDTKKPVLGLATGSTPEGLYEYLIEKCKKGELSFRDVSSFNLDEYIGLDADDPNSYSYFMQEKLFNHIDIKQDATHLPDGTAANLEAACEEYERKIKEADSVDLQILGLGQNGHIGFNEPGTPFESRTHIIDLAESTREANARFFPSMEDVPKQAITMGIATIMESKEILMLVAGKGKEAAREKLLSGEVSEGFPASVLNNHPNVTVIYEG